MCVSGWWAGQWEPAVASWWLTFCWKMWVKSLSAEEEKKTKAETEPFMSVYLCVNVYGSNLILHLSLCFLLAGLSSFLLSLLVSVYPISVCLWFMCCCQLETANVVITSSCLPHPKELNNSSGSAAGLWTAQISAQGEWGGHLGTVTAPGVWGWAVSSRSCEPVSPPMAQARYKAVLWPRALLNLA